MDKLDLKDRKILYELDTNSSQSFNEIAKKVRLSKDSIIYRITRLKESGIIKQFHTVIDVGKLGYISFRLYLKLKNTTKEKEIEIINYLKKQKQITWLVSIDGDYDLGMWILVKSIKEMNQLWTQILTNYLNYIDKRDLTIFTKVSYFPRVYFIEKKQNLEEFVFITEPVDEKEQKIDEKDINLLKLLSANSRISILELSKKLGLTPKTVVTRIRDLENQKVIIGYRTMFDLEKLGFQYFKVHINLENTDENKISRFRSFVKLHPNIIYDNQVLGGDDLEIEIQTKDIQSLRLILDEIKNQFSGIIRNCNYMTFYKEHKFIFFPDN